jgi:membrane associated rhomboid family serine protease
VVHQGQVWRLLTHAFCHDRHSIWHIVFNMLLLFWFGPTLESMYGSREFLLFYLTAAVVAGLFFVGLDLWLGTTVPGIGASGAVMAVMMLYTWHYPRDTICIFWFFPIEIRWLMLFYLIFDLHPVLLALSGDRISTGIAHAAHLGGLAFGFCYAKFDWRLEPILDRLTARPARRRQPLKKLSRTLVARPGAEPEPDRDRLDELLEKISLSGQASLTDEERAILQKASERFRNQSKRPL